MDTVYSEKDQALHILDEHNDIKSNEPFIDHLSEYLQPTLFVNLCQSVAHLQSTDILSKKPPPEPPPDIHKNLHVITSNDAIEIINQPLPTPVD